MRDEWGGKVGERERDVRARECIITHAYTHARSLKHIKLACTSYDTFDSLRESMHLELSSSP